MPRDPLRRDADAIAIEQCIWWASASIRPDEALEAMGIEWPAGHTPDWHDAQLAAAIFWRRLCDMPAELPTKKGRLRLVTR